MRELDREYKGAEHPIGESDQEYKRGGALQVKCLRIFWHQKALVIKE
jgi:hypothetical protein